MSTHRRKLLQQPPKVVERYVRLLMHRRAQAFARAAARKLTRPRLQLSERKRKSVLASTLATFAKEAAKAKRLNFQASAAVLNLGLFFLIAEKDIQAVKIDALTHSDAWQRSLCARVILLTIHELDIDKVAGNKLRQAMADAKVPDRMQKDVASSLRTVRKAQEKAQRKFAILRNSTIAHRDADAVLQHRAITELDSVEVIKIAAEFYEGTHAFMAVLPELLKLVGTIPGLLNQMSAQTNRTK